MPEYLSPGVYVEEISTGPVPIEGVGTSTAGFIGQTERGPTAPRLVTNWLEYQRIFGGHVNPGQVSWLPFAVQGFFDNGGRRLFIARVTTAGAAAGTIDLATANPNQDLRVTAVGPGDWVDRVFVRVEAGQPGGFKLTLLYYRTLPPLPLVDPLDAANVADPNRREPDVVEVYDNLGFDPLGPGYVLAAVNGASNLLELSWSDPDLAAAPPDRPNDIPFTQFPAPAAAGAPALADHQAALARLEAIDEIALLCVPDEVKAGLNQLTDDVLLQCERLKDRFAVLQVDQGQANVAAINPARRSLYGAIYYPWIRVFDPLTQDTLLVPPGGHVVGIYARTDIERGVHKAPANEDVRGIITRDLSGGRTPLEFRVTKGGHDILNPRGVNVIRDFRADRRGIRVWGARTLATDAQWKYVNVRRLFIFIEESIDEGTQWVVFEPNDEPTWARVRRSIANFLSRVWGDGALMGASEEEAFFVRCDRTTMTQDDIDNGRLICYVGIAPVKPAEFVIFRISQKTIEATT